MAHLEMLLVQKLKGDKNLFGIEIKWSLREVGLDKEGADFVMVKPGCLI